MSSQSVTIGKPRTQPLPVDKLVLLLAGVVAAFVGVSLLIDPRHFYTQYGVDLTPDASMFSELRGTGALLVSAAAALTLGACVSKYRAYAALLGSVLYLGYAGGRMVSVWLDGRPHANLLYAALAELVLGLACAAVFGREQRRL